MKPNNTDQSIGEHLARFVIRHRWAVLIVSIVMALFAGYGAQNIVMKNDYRIFFSKTNPQLEAYEALQQIYTKDDNILMAVINKDGSAFEPGYLAAVQWLTDEAWKLPYVSRVDSITNYQHSEAFEDDLNVADLVEDPSTLTESDLQRIAEIVRAEPLTYNRLIGDNDFISGVNITQRMPGKDAMEAMESAAAARELRERFETKYPEFEVKLTGVTMMNNAFGESSMNDMSSIIPLMYLGIFVAAYIFLRSIAGTIATVGVVILSSMTAIGLMGWLNIAMSPPVATAPQMIMTLAIADSIHVLVTLLHEMRSGRRKNEAIIESLRINFQPVFLTSLTTIIGFLSMNFSDAPPFRDLGNVVAIGVLAAWLFSIFTLPALMAILPVKVKIRETERSSAMDRLAERVIRFRRPILWGSVGLITVMAIAVPKLQFNDQFVEYFGKSVEYRQDTDYTMDHLTGIYTLEYSVTSTESGGINEPDYLAKLDAFSNWFRAQPGVLQSYTLADVMKRLNKNMHSDDASYYTLPQERDLAAQYLLLFEMSLPYGLDLNNLINFDKSATRVTVTLENLTTQEVRSLIEGAETWMAENFPAHMRGEAASPMVMFSYISERNIKSMLIGTGIAVILISFVLAFALRSPRYGALSLVPNLVPAVVGFGIWTLLIGEMGLSLSTVTGMTLGIVVDDTVHFLSKYLRARRERGLDAQGAVKFAFRHVATALVITTVILVVGFGILSLSSFRLNSWMGQMTAIVIAAALILDLLFLPAFLITVDDKKESKATNTINLETDTNETALA